ncbi:PD-(D/E)XK nuclease superfamily protein [Geodermatophilus siccatus]|uniref:PD-(D/E)XK nuclease superfamily protein n=1 Tax=Geodermatophilus siccatus TaxID=1137991 RepID=A0A1G9NI97_9ACTN|nr:PD-(D/E)XK nuclease family protein [Geodermatophilus siccatus]SDL86084.1 PD-(D/E)XK nuclease superfamily protein [Geodermatophilus siccatus]
MTAVLPARPSAAERRAAPSLAAAVRDLDSRRARSRQRMIGASELGECRRRAAYRIARRRPTNTRTGLQAFMGTELHRGVLRALRRQYGGLTEVGLRGEQVRGRCDWWHAPVVEDLKTTSRFGFERVLTRGVPVRHWFQVAVYAWLLRTGQTADRRLPAGDGQDVDGLRIRYLSRDSGEDVVFEADHDPALTAEAIMWLTDVYAAVEDEGVDAVPRDGFGPGVDTMCDWCPFLDLCWGPPVDPETEGEVSRQSRLTVTDEDYVEAVHDYDAWRAAENEAKRHKEYARERLRGRSGPADDLYCEWSGGGLRTQVDKDAAVERLVELGEVLPTRRTRSPQTIRVTRSGTRQDRAAGPA